MANDTETFVSRAPADAASEPGWAVTVALDCERPAAMPLRLALARVAEVEIGRGEARVARRDGDRLRLDLPDRWASGRHARLVRSARGWVVEDAGSKNGTRRNGATVGRAELADGDVVECGGSFLVVRCAPGPIRDLEPRPDGPDALRTVAPALERALAGLPEIARAPLAVLIRGESGTGKEVAAAAIHALSGRSGPFLPVNCGAIPPALIESELFGSRRGAFSGAVDRTGLVRSAERGTLFLDEVAELPAASQVALLRVLQEREVLPLGADRPLPVDIRVIAATNQPLGPDRFRRDLLARLRGHELRLPTLRQRLEDLGLLVGALLARIAPGRAPRFTRAAARALFLHAWPFQIRELEQALRAAVARAGGDEIGVEHLELAPPPSSEPAAHDDRDGLAALLARHGGNLSAVARELATSRTHVQRLLARHGLSVASFRRR